MSYRPEKDHTAQVLAFYELMDSQGESAGESLIKLVLIGGSRNADDAARVEELKKLAEELKIQVRRSPLISENSIHLLVPGSC